jgi:pimeloyl-ACP methyl ester carboxylesterase
MLRWASLVGALALAALATAGANGRALDPLASAPEQESRKAARPMGQTPPLERVTVADLNVAYRVIGDGAPLILIMGFGGTMDIWDPTLLRELAATYRVIVFDNRGMGGTTGPASDFSIEQLADDTAGLLDALGVERAHVLGYSMGGYVAQELALKYPERVNRLVLMGTGCGGTEGIPARPEALRALTDMSGSIAEVLQRVISVLVPADWSRDHGGYLESVLMRAAAPPDRASLARQERAMDTWRGTCERLAQLRAPTQVLAGTADEVLAPANALMLVNRIPGAWLAQFPDGGHGMQYQYPGEIAATIRAFLEAP